MRFPPRRPAPVRITDARLAHSEDIRHRQRRYAITMGIRTVCVILAVVLWQVDRIAAVIAVVCGGVLPYIAVVFANAGHERAPGPPDTQVTPKPPPQLPESPGTRPPDSPRSPAAEPGDDTSERDEDF